MDGGVLAERLLVVAVRVRHGGIRDAGHPGYAHPKGLILGASVLRFLRRFDFGNVEGTRKATVRGGVIGAQLHDQVRYR